MLRLQIVGEDPIENLLFYKFQIYNSYCKLII